MHKYMTFIELLHSVYSVSLEISNIIYTLIFHNE